MLNSNRLQVLERIALPDPSELAMAPNLDLLAVTQRASDEVAFLDVDPASSTFHQVVKTVAVGDAPRGIAWDPGNEDLLVCNEGDSSLAVISVFSLSVRKTVTGFLDRPFDVVITQRQDVFGFHRNVYFGWILNRSDELAIFESGPSGINGWGYDDTIGVAPMEFGLAKRLAPDFAHLGGGVWIVHAGPLDATGRPTGVLGGALTNVRIESSLTGTVPLTASNLATPQFRGMRIQVDASIDESQLTGIPVDLAQDDQVNLGVLPNLASVFSAGSPAAQNGKSQVRQSNGPVVPAKSPQLLFLAVPSSREGPGVVDAIDLGTGLRIDTDPWLPGVQSIPVPGVKVLCDYWRP